MSFGESDYFLCVNKKRPDLLKELNTAQEMLSVEEPNYIYSLKAKYYPSTLSAMTFSAAEKAWLDEHSMLRIGYLENYMPYSDTDAQGNVTGIVKNMTAQMLKQLGIDEEIQGSFLEDIAAGRFKGMVFDDRYITVDRAPLTKSALSSVLFGIAIGVVVFFVTRNAWLSFLVAAAWALAFVFLGAFAEINRQKEALHTDNAE